MSNLDEVAEFLDLKSSTLRSRKSRGSIPYEEIISKLDVNEIGFVFKGPLPEESTGSANEPESNYRNSTADEYEREVEELIHKINLAPFSRDLKLRLIDTIVELAGKEFKNLEKPSDAGLEKEERP